MAARIRQPIYRLHLQHTHHIGQLTSFTRDRYYCSTKIIRSGSSNTDAPSSRLPQYDVSPSFKLTQPPNPSWKIGQGLAREGVSAKEWNADENEGWKTWNMQETPLREVYRLLTSAVVPQPIAFISSLSADGIPNLAPFSYFSLVAHNPPLLSVSFSLPPRRPKDTRQNILATKEFTVNIISEPFAEAANATSIEAPAEVDEWVLSGLTREESTHVKPPRVKESAVSLECELFSSHEICPPNSKDVTNTLVLGLIKTVHVRNAVMREDGTVDPRKLRAIARLGGDTYARVGEGFDIPRPSWRAIQESLT